MVNFGNAQIILTLGQIINLIMFCRLVHGDYGGHCIVTGAITNVNYYYFGLWSSQPASQRCYMHEKARYMVIFGNAQIPIP